MNLDAYRLEPAESLVADDLDNSLLNMNHVVVTPHDGGSSEDCVERALFFTYKNARCVLVGEDPDGQIEVLT
ncbi:MAG: hypothetical protein HOC77_06930 [Chloroflexi bacterium]|nr:hypothetical protein [Chloroflexota bacterium]MBT5320091.1 hypothetical protein [Chloroflexota bacterium]